MSNRVFPPRSLNFSVFAVLFAAFAISGCYRESRDERVPVSVNDAPAVVAADTEGDGSIDDSVYAVRVLEARCYRIQEGRRVGERIRNFFAYSLVDQEAMEHYREEFGNPRRRGGEASPSASDDDVFCEYVPSSNRDFTVLVDGQPVGLSSTDSSGVLRVDNVAVDENSTVVAVDSVTGDRVVVRSPEDVPLPEFGQDDEAADSAGDAPAASGDGADSLDDDPQRDEVDYSDVPPGGPFDNESPIESPPGAPNE